MEKLSELFWEKSRTVELRTESILLELIAEFTESGGCSERVAGTLPDLPGAD